MRVGRGVRRDAIVVVAVKLFVIALVDELFESKELSLLLLCGDRASLPRGDANAGGEAKGDGCEEGDRRRAMV